MGETREIRVRDGQGWSLAFNDDVGWSLRRAGVDGRRTLGLPPGAVYPPVAALHRGLLVFDPSGRWTRFYRVLARLLFRICLNYGTGGGFGAPGEERGVKIVYIRGKQTQKKTG
jgi:hypothetical protein